MSDNKSRDIFYGVVAVATLIVALIGATLAYFSMTASSGEGAVSAQAAVVSVNYEDGQNVLAQAKNLIPVTYEIMKTQYQTNLAAMEAQALLALIHVYSMVIWQPAYILLWKDILYFPKLTKDLYAAAEYMI